MTPTAEKTFFGHPRGLATLFLTEMWERFSYYGMRTLLVLYMVQYLFSDLKAGADIWGYQTILKTLESIHGPMGAQALSSHIYGLYTGLVYFTPFFGGWLADRYLGQRRAVYVGGVLMAIGHFLMAAENLFFPALLFLIVGNGFFKPNISTQVGGLYAQGDDRRDRAYMIFYMGINLGGFLSPLICGTLGQKVGWHWGFGAAGVGMLLSLVLYYMGRKYLPEVERKSVEQIHKESSQKMTGTEWKAVGALVYLCILNIVFWGVYEQQGNTLQLWAEQNTDLVFFNWNVPSTWYQSVNPFMIFTLTPLLGILWAWQSKLKKEPGSIAKMGIGCLLAGLALVVMFWAYKTVGDGKGSIAWLLATTLLLTVGELYLSPIGLSLVTKVAPARMVSMMMGIWLMSSFFGNYLSGYLGSFYETMSKDSFFMMLAFLGFGSAILFFLSRKPLEHGLGKKI
ncbi:Di-/tripeptide transporter [compost metagenome]